MDIPTDIPRRINKSLKDLLSLSIVYIPTPDLYIEQPDGSIIVRFPYSKNTFWTNFQYSVISCISDGEITLKTKIIIKANDEVDYTLSSLKETESKKWYDTNWPIPSVNTIHKKAGVYLKLCDCKHLPHYTIRIKMLGFLNIYPDVDRYYLLSPQNTYLYVFTINDDGAGSIYSTENKQIISKVGETIQGITMIN